MTVPHCNLNASGLRSACIELRAENERLRKQLVSDINAEAEIDRLETEIERLRAQIRKQTDDIITLGEQACERGAEIERLRNAFKSLHWHLVENTVNKSVFLDIVEQALKMKG